jgi:hypothetical protein
MSASNEKVVEEKIPWHFLIPFMVILGFLAPIYNTTNPLDKWMNPPHYSATIALTIICYSGLVALPFISFYFAGALGRLSFFKKRVNPTSLTWLYIITLCLSYYMGIPGGMSYCASYGVFLGNRILSSAEETARLIPWFMAPPKDVAVRALYGNTPVPWIDLMPMIMFWWIFMVVNGLLVVFIATLFRKNWIDIERVPFPHTLAAYELLIRVIPEDKKKTVRLKTPFIIGLVIGLIVWVPTLLLAYFPWFPDILGLKTHVCAYGAYNVWPGDPLASIPGMSRIGREPLGVAIAYFAPLKVLFNIWFWWLVLVIMIQVSYFLGYYTGLPDTPACGRIWCATVSPTYQPPLKSIALLSGGVIALVVLILVTNWRYIRDTINIALGRMGAVERAEFERGEPISYRMIWPMIIMFAIVAVAIYLVCGINPLSAVLNVVNMFVMYFATMRFIGLVGIYYRGADKGCALHRLLVWPQAPESLNTDFALSAYFNNMFGDCAPDTMCSIGGVFLTTFQGYKMASLTGVSSRSVFKVSVASVVIFSLTTMLSFLWMCYTFGLTKVPAIYGMHACNGIVQRFANLQNWNNRPGTEPWTPHFIAGFIIVALLSLLHTRFIWFPFEPVGFILGMGAGYEMGYWSYALVAWILKTITLKIGGSKAYEEWGVPIAAGYVAGHMLVLIPGSIIATIKYFVPF